jgi:hypothetical protein
MVLRIKLNLVTRRQEVIEAHDEIRVTLEELLHTQNDAWGIDTGHSTGRTSAHEPRAQENRETRSPSKHHATQLGCAKEQASGRTKNFPTITDPKSGDLS